MNLDFNALQTDAANGRKTKEEMQTLYDRSVREQWADDAKAELAIAFDMWAQARSDKPDWQADVQWAQDLQYKLEGHWQDVMGTWHGPDDNPADAYK